MTEQRFLNAIVNFYRFLRSNILNNIFQNKCYGMSDACVAQLVRIVDPQSEDPGSNPGTVENFSFSTERF